MSGHRAPQQVPDYTGLNLQTSSMSVPCPLMWGRARGSPNLMDYLDYQVHKHTVGKGGSFFGKSTEYTYSATILLALCEGPIDHIGEVYVNQGQTTDLSQYHFTLFTGTTPQSPWSYLVSAHPTHALSYQGVCYLAAKNYNLGSSASLPSQSFEVYGVLQGTQVGGNGDADPAQVVYDFLTNAQYGTYFSSARIDGSIFSTGAATTTGDSNYQTYCRAQGIGISPFIQSQERASDILARWCQITNTAPVWTGYSLKLIPFGDETITAHGVTYLPPTTSVFSVADDDYVRDGTNDPVAMARADWFDAYNAVILEIRQRDYLYNTVPIDWIDQPTVDRLGRRPASTIQGHEICELAMGQMIVELIARRMVYIRNQYTFRVPPHFDQPEPMDCGTITDAVLGLVNLPVRIRHIDEQDNGDFIWVVEEFPGTTGSPENATTTGGPSPIINTLTVPDAVNTPIIFEPNSTAAAFLNNGSTAPLIVILASGGSGGVADPNWGGYIVNVSTDNLTYVQLDDIGGSSRVVGPASMGVLTAGLGSYSGANPDTGHTLAVDLSESAGSLVSASSGSTAAAGATLAVIQDSGGAVELVGPQTANLTGTYTYNLTNLYRGLFSTPGLPAPAHLSGALFGRLDGTGAFVAALPPAYIGVTLYFKLQSFNAWGNALQDISTCTVYTYTPAGTGSGGGSGGVPTTPTGLTTAPAAGQVVVSWAANPVTDNVTAYDVYRAPGTGASFGSASLIAVTAGLNYTDTGLPPSTGYTYFLKAQNAVGLSAATAGVNATTSPAAAGGATTTATVTEAGGLTAGKLCFLYSSTGAKVELANATDASKPANCFVQATYANGATATVYFPGQYITGLSLTAGATYYLDVTAGGIVTTPPSTSGNVMQEVGVADETGTMLFFNPKPAQQQ